MQTLLNFIQMMPSVHFDTFPSITTERLVLRQLTMQDDADLFSLRSNEQVNQYLDRPKTLSVEDAREFIRKILTGVENSKWFYWALCLKTDPALIGTICIWNIDAKQSKAEIGYELLPSFQGKGLMQEAIVNVIDFGLQQLQLAKIEAWTVNGNIQSIKILERNGFKRDIDAEKKIDRSIEGDNAVIFSLHSNAVKL
jgi:ribosomal-protein-alanine N-acetyltransferase